MGRRIGMLRLRGRKAGTSDAETASNASGPVRESTLPEMNAHFDGLLVERPRSRSRGASRTDTAGAGQGAASDCSSRGESAPGAVDDGNDPDVDEIDAVELFGLPPEAVHAVAEGSAAAALDKKTRAIYEAALRCVASPVTGMWAVKRRKHKEAVEAKWGLLGKAATRVGQATYLVKRKDEDEDDDAEGKARLAQVAETNSNREQSARKTRSLVEMGTVGGLDACESDTGVRNAAGAVLMAYMRNSFACDVNEHESLLLGVQRHADRHFLREVQQRLCHVESHEYYSKRAFADEADYVSWRDRETHRLNQLVELMQDPAAMAKQAKDGKKGASKKSQKKRDAEAAQERDRPFMGTLVVTVKNAEGLMGKDKTGFSDPFCVLTYADVALETSVIDQNLNPVWNETFSWDVHLHDDGALSIYVWDKDLVRKNDFLGKLDIDIDCQRMIEPVKFHEELQKRSKRSHVSGYLNFRIQFQPFSAPNPADAPEPFHEYLLVLLRNFVQYERKGPRKTPALSLSAELLLEEFCARYGVSQAQFCVNYLLLVVDDLEKSLPPAPLIRCVLQRIEDLNEARRKHLPMTTVEMGAWERMATRIFKAASKWILAFPSSTGPDPTTRIDLGVRLFMALWEHPACSGQHGGMTASDVLGNLVSSAITTLYGSLATRVRSDKAAVRDFIELADTLSDEVAEEMDLYSAPLANGGISLSERAAKGLHSLFILDLYNLVSIADEPADSDVVALLVAVREMEDLFHSIYRDLPPISLSDVFFPFISRWLKGTLARLTTWSRQAVANDTFLQLSVDEPHSTSVLDIFCGMHQTLDFFKRIEWPERGLPSQQRNSALCLQLARVAGTVIEHYAKDLVAVLAGQLPKPDPVDDVRAKTGPSSPQAARATPPQGQAAGDELAAPAEATKPTARTRATTMLKKAGNFFHRAEPAAAPSPAAAPLPPTQQEQPRAKSPESGLVKSITTVVSSAFSTAPLDFVPTELHCTIVNNAFFARMQLNAFSEDLHDVVLLPPGAEEHHAEAVDQAFTSSFRALGDAQRQLLTMIQLAVRPRLRHYVLKHVNAASKVGDGTARPAKSDASLSLKRYVKRIKRKSKGDDAPDSPGGERKKKDATPASPMVAARVAAVDDDIFSYLDRILASCHRAIYHPIFAAFLRAIWASVVLALEDVAVTHLSAVQQSEMGSLTAALKDFFHADGDGVPLGLMEGGELQIVLQVRLGSLSTSDLIARFHAIEAKDLASQGEPLLRVLERRRSDRKARKFVAEQRAALAIQVAVAHKLERARTMARQTSP